MRAQNDNAALEFVQEDETDVPKCMHGSAFLFRRVTAAGKTTLFYACSAYRDRKKCAFYLSKEDFERKKRRRLEGSSININAQVADEKANDVNALQRLRTVRKQKIAQRTFCLQCDQFVLGEEIASHQNHKLKTSITDDLLTHPTQLLELTVQNKAEAQFIFSDESARFLLSALQREKVRCTVMIGCPRLFEMQIELATSSKQKSHASLLLDIDERYGHFYEASVFQRYNMFNHFFFDAQFDIENWLRAAFKTTRCAPTILIDPPFGGLTDALCATLKKWQTLWNTIVQQGLEKGEVADGISRTLNIVWVFPYFQERRIRSHLRELKMLDYRVAYANHPRFTISRLRNKPSPIRIFTNLSSHSFRFDDQASAADSEGPSNTAEVTESSFYRWCAVCDSITYRKNRHCDKCGRCTTKHGATYQHCDTCGRCVKPTRVHCDSCGRCVLPKQHNHAQACSTSSEKSAKKPVKEKKRSKKAALHAKQS